MNQLKGKNNAPITNQPQIRTTLLETMPSLENNNILSENDEYCYELDKSTYSHISNTNKSEHSNSNIIQMISQLSDYNINNNEDINNNDYCDLPLQYINHLPKNEKKNNINSNKTNLNNVNKNKNLNINNNNLEDNNRLTNSKNSSYNYEANELNINNNNDIDNNIDNEWNDPKITFSEISKVSKAISLEENEGIMDNDDFDTNNNINKIDDINLMKENLDIKKNLKNKNNENIFENNNINLARHKKNKTSKFLIDDNIKLNFINSQYSSVDFLKQTINNCLLKSGYKDVIDNSEKFLAKSSSLDILNEYSNINPDNEKIKKNLIMQMVLFNNMKSEMEILKKENTELVRTLNFLKKEKLNFVNKNEEIVNENNKKINEINHLNNKIKKYKNYYKEFDNLKNEYKNLVKKNEHLIKNNEKINTENKILKEELIKIKFNKKDNYNDNNENIDIKKKELINKINRLLKDNNNLNELIEKKNVHIINLEQNINKQNIDIANYIEKIKLLQDKYSSKSKSNNKNKKSNNKIKNKSEQNEINNDLAYKIIDIIDKKAKQNSNNENNINQKLINNKINNIEYYKNKIQEKNALIEKLKSENLDLINQNKSNLIQIQEISNLKNQFNIIGTQNNELKNEIKELKIKYAELIDENNTNINIKNNLVEKIEKLNMINKEQVNEINILKQNDEKINKKIILSYNTLINFAKKLKGYASKEFQKNNMNLFLKGFKELIEKLNNQKYNLNKEEIKGFESICDFINLIPLEIEILYKRILSLQNDINNNNMNINKNNNINNINNINYSIKKKFY